MKASEVDGARDYVISALQKYEAFAVVTACLSVVAYVLREMLKLGVASPRFVVIAFGCALRLAFEKNNNGAEEQRLGETH